MPRCVYQASIAKRPSIDRAAYRLHDSSLPTVPSRLCVILTRFLFTNVIYSSLFAASDSVPPVHRICRPSASVPAIDCSHERDSRSLIDAVHGCQLLHMSVDTKHWTWSQRCFSRSNPRTGPLFWTRFQTDGGYCRLAGTQYNLMTSLVRDTECGRVNEAFTQSKSNYTGEYCRRCPL